MRVCARYSGLIPIAFTSAPKRALSCRTVLAITSGELPLTTSPAAVSRSAIAGSASASSSPR